MRISWRRNYGSASQQNSVAAPPRVPLPRDSALSQCRLARRGELLPGPTVSPRSDEVILQEAHRGVPARLVVLLARNHEQVVAVLGVVTLQRGRQPIVDLLVRQLEAPSLFGVELDRNRLVAAVQEHVPSVRMALHTLVV